MLGMLGLGQPAHAEPVPETLVDAINDAVARGDYTQAAALLEEAYQADPQPTYLYSKGEALLAANDCVGAQAAFDRFLATAPPEIDAAAARDRRASCTPPAPPPKAEPEPPPPQVTPSNPPPPAPRRLARDPVFWGLTGTGSVLALAGAGLLVGAKLSADATGGAATEGTWEVEVARSRGLATAGTVAVGVGGALLVGAVVRAIILRRER